MTEMDEQNMRSLDSPDEERAELAALADGTLPAERRRALEDEVARSPRLEALLAEQELAVSLVHGLDAPAPASLRTHVNRAVRRRSSRRRVAVPPRIAAIGAAGAVVLALILALALPSGTGGPTLVEAAALAHLRPYLPAPAHDRANGDLLAAAQSGVAFPFWQDTFRWRASGTRTDRIGGRQATTVFYSRGRRRIAYSIVSGGALSGASHWQKVRRSGVSMWVDSRPGYTTVTWQRRGHSCVLSGRDVPPSTLERLVAWHGRSGVLYSEG